MSFDWESFIDSLYEVFAQIPGFEQVEAFVSDPDFWNKLAQVAKVVGIALAVVAVLFAILGLLSYILRSVALYTIARRRGCKLCGFAWVPVLWNWTLGSVADAHEKTYSRDRRWRVVLLCVSVLALGAGILTCGKNIAKASALFSVGEMGLEAIRYILVAVLSFFGASKSLGSVAKVLRWVCYEKLFESCAKRPVFLTVLVILLPVTLPFVLMAVRKRDAGVKVA